MSVQSTSVSGYLKLRLLASFKRLRPWSYKFREEQVAIDDWLGLVARAAARSPGTGARSRRLRAAHQGLWRHAEARAGQLPHHRHARDRAGARTATGRRNTPPTRSPAPAPPRSPTPRARASPAPSARSKPAPASKWRRSSYSPQSLPLDGGGKNSALFPTGRSGMSDITVGAWRTDRSGPMQIISGPMGRERVHFEAPAAPRLGLEMHTFLHWFNSDDGTNLVLKAGIAHLWFVTVHPFDDGNGRIARAIADRLLAHAEKSAQRFYSMSAQIQARSRRLLQISRDDAKRRSRYYRSGSIGFSGVSAAPSTERKRY